MFWSPFLLTLSSFALLSKAFWVGIGKSDVTGPVADVGLMGYADPVQLGSGILMRLYARSFLILPEDEDKEPMLIIHTDIHSIALKLRQKVAATLSSKAYTTPTGKKVKLEPRNIIIHAQHTHSAPGGYHPSVLFFITIFGFTEEHFHLLHERIVASAEDAIMGDNQFEADLYFSRHTLLNTGRNRSPEAFFNNPKEETDAYQKKYQGTKNSNMGIVRIEEKMTGDTKAVLSFFAIHTTSFTKENNMINSDNKGFAEYLIEKRFPEITAAFFASESGDVSPNMADDFDTEFLLKQLFTFERRGFFKGEGKDFVESAELMGRKQADVVMGLLYDREKRETEIKLDGKKFGSRLEYIDYNSYKLPDGETTCPGLIGAGMLSGTEDGRGIPFLQEGFTRARVAESTRELILSQLTHYAATVVTSNPYFHPEKRTLRGVKDYILDTVLKFDHAARLNLTDNEVDSILKCHGEKLPAMWSGFGDHPLVPHVIPVQLLQIGDLYLPAIPFEVTSMSGERIRKALLSSINTEGSIVEIISLSNAYGVYLATEEEYEMQHYEGASTHYGPKQLDATIDVVVKLEQAMKAQCTRSTDFGCTQVETGLTHEFSTLLHHKLSKVQSGDSWLFKNLKELFRIKNGKYIGLEHAKEKSYISSFYCEAPGNTQRNVTSFCDVEVKQRNGNIETLLTEEDWYIRYFYREKFPLFGTCSCEWIPQTEYEDLKGQQFRFRIHGTDYSGASEWFTVDGNKFDYNLDNYLVYTRVRTLVVIALVVVLLVRRVFFHKVDK
eukprot:maker-scaffold_15-snap-gene-2.20-mRNA-1 protein AED:0.01 eAED:0.01 QI:141/1/1/1/1/1/5/46/779